VLWIRFSLLQCDELKIRNAQFTVKCLLEAIGLTDLMHEGISSNLKFIIFMQHKFTIQFVQCLSKSQVESEFSIYGLQISTEKLFFSYELRFSGGMTSEREKRRDCYLIIMFM
jgi:hypothetical protein